VRLDDHLERDQVTSTTIAGGRISLDTSLGAAMMALAPPTAGDLLSFAKPSDKAAW
jgi:hypothetical protein